MSKVIAEQLLSGIIFGDLDNCEYVYLPGGEVGSDNPMCIFQQGDCTEDVGLERASDLVLQLTLRPCKHPVLGKRAY